MRWYFDRNPINWCHKMCNKKCIDRWVNPKPKCKWDNILFQMRSEFSLVIKTVFRLVNHSFQPSINDTDLYLKFGPFMIDVWFMCVIYKIARFFGRLASKSRSLSGEQNKWVNQMSMKISWKKNLHKFAKIMEGIQRKCWKRSLLIQNLNIARKK